MDLKFSLGGAAPDHHDHGAAAPGIPLPFAGATSLGQNFAPMSNSSELDIVVRIERAETVALVVGEAVTGDGVTYARGEVSCDPSAVDPSAPDLPALARAVRSAAARAVAGLEGPLALAITSVQLQLGRAPDGTGLGSAVLAELGVAADSPAVSEALQARIGVNTGVPIRVS